MRRVFAVVAVAVSCLGGALSVSPSPVAARPAKPSLIPTGFVDTVLDNPAGNSISSPTTIVPLAGDRALILEKRGAVRVLGSDGKLVAADALALTVCTGSEMGLLGAAVDPAFNVNGFVYLYYTRDGGDCNSGTGRFNRVSRFTMTANTIDPNSELVLLDNISAKGGNHDGGGLQVGQDGYLYVAIGDAGSNPRGASDTAAEDLSLLNGKIVRITTTGGVPADNPFVGNANAVSCATAGISTSTSQRCLEVYSWGLRNPYRFAFDPNTGATRFFINDVGQGTWEEVDEGGKGLDYGWNTREGSCLSGSSTNCPAPPAQFTDPLTSYNHTSGCTYITGGAFIPNGIWPAEYDNGYLFADGGCGKMWLRTGAGTVDYATPFAETTGGIVDMAFITQGPDPALYYVTNGDSKVHKITYDAAASKNDSALAYSPLAAATRPYDTRSNLGVAPGTIRAGTTRYVDLGIGNTARAALVNLTMVDSLGTGYVVASEGRTEHPSSSNLNVSTGEVAANTSIVPVDSTGRIVVFASVTTHLIVDVLGVFTAVGPSDPGGRFVSLAPGRLIDTRNPANATTNAYSEAGTSPNTDLVRTVVGGKLGVPGAVKAVALIVTAVSDPGDLAGFTTVYPSGTSLPPTSNLNTNGGGDARPNLVIVPLGADGGINIHLQSTADVVVDVAGYFVDTTSPAGLYHVVAPSRQVDTRVPTGFGSLGLNGTGTLSPKSPVPAGAAAVSQNLTMTRSLGPGFVTAYPSDQPLPLASNANVSGPNQDHASLSFTKLGAGGITYYSSGGTDLVVDITGYFEG